VQAFATSGGRFNQAVDRKKEAPTPTLVRSHPINWTDGGGRSIAESLRRLMQSLNQTLETPFLPGAVFEMAAFEALRTGKKKFCRGS